MRKFCWQEAVLTVSSVNSQYAKIPREISSRTGDATSARESLISNRTRHNMVQAMLDATTPALNKMDCMA